MDARQDADDPGLRDTFGSFSLRELWQLTNRPQPVDPPAVRAACLLLFVFYVITSIVRHVPEQPLLLGLRAAVLAYSAIGIVLAPRFSWAALRVYTVGLALLLPTTTAALVALRGNHPGDLALTALAVFAPAVFLQTAADVLLVLVLLGCETIVLVTSAGPPGLSSAVTGLVLGGTLVAGLATALVLIAFRGRVSESTTWWQQACARERALRELVELAAPHLGDAGLANEFARHFHRAFGPGRCAIMLLDRDDGTVRVAATAGEPAGAASAPSVAMLRLVLAAVTDRQPLVLERLSVDDAERRFGGLPWLTPGGTLVVLPIVGDESVAGAILLSAAAARPIERDDLLLWRAMANQVGVAVGSAQLFARLQQALRARSEFVNTMSHELRSPLHVILGYAELLADGTQEPGFVAARVRASGLELLQLVDNTLTAARLGSGKLRAQPSEFPLAELIGELRETLGAQPEASNGVALRWESSRDLPVVRLDRLKLKEIVHNLVSNALKFTERGEVVVRVGREGTRVRIDVEDTGSGIPPEAQTQIFEMFERLETDRGTGGAGLGLYIVKNLVQLMGGTVTLASEPGHGSRFTVWLPIGIDSV